MAQQINNGKLNSPSVGRDITPGTPFKACAGVNCYTTAGVGTVTWLDGSTSSFYFTLGNNACQITNVASGGLTASGLTALYNV